ncbi:hypothetical protein CLTEP_02400 [Clostridium tepidiprofundi DSM 19306]|uniref:Uncharacterized protein n=1 Tax=Clostridium tepidiprofundi DSM 19306 TaxID=1121338 RepID=A0A151B870_9CLOT|nr:hypothetical protein [Clostridium tepidiprofundi]KYH35847.1 hypothetical protein CLTEP_02400 [Clostridium tepidiprofundi DSM 19306]
MNEFKKRKQVEEWLRDYKSIKASIKNLKEEYKLLQDTSSAIDVSKEVVSKTNKFNSEVENTIIKLNELENRIKRMEHLINKIDRALNTLNDTEREIVINRCIENKYYYQFTHLIYVSERTAKRIKQEALRKMVIVMFGL